MCITPLWAADLSLTLFTKHLGLGCGGQKQTVQIALQDQIGAALAWNANLKPKLGASFVPTEVIGHSQGSINATLAVERMDAEDIGMIDLIDVGTATPRVPSGLHRFLSIMDSDDPVSNATLSWLQPLNSNYVNGGPNYSILRPNLNAGNNHSFYLYAQQPSVQSALGWQAIQTTTPFLK